MKMCNRCGVPKHPNAFRKNRWVCKQCSGGQDRRTRLTTKYGISYEEFSAMLDAQQGECAICRDPFEGEPHVDHDHETGTVRGLLCDHCNLGLGHFKDDKQRLWRAADYLRGMLDVDDAIR